MSTSASSETPAPGYRAISAPELVVGLVYGAGTNIDPIERLLAERLDTYDYELRSIRLTRYFSALLDADDFSRDSPDGVRRLQDMGDELRQRTLRPDLLAQLAVYLIASERSQTEPHRPRTAWLIRSLRRPEEVAWLRQLYGPRFVLLAVHDSEGQRLKSAERTRRRWANVTASNFELDAKADILRDEDDSEQEYGQRTRKTFAEADFFIDARTSQRLEHSLPRAVRLMFGEPFEPPTRDEQAMYHAFAAGLQSTEMGRQVGAAIATPAGELVAVGVNEVPRAGGGLYSSPQVPDRRDFAQQPPLDSNTEWQRRIARELVIRMVQRGWLVKSKVKEIQPRADTTDKDFDADDDTLGTTVGGRWSFLTRVRHCRASSRIRVPSRLVDRPSAPRRCRGTSKRRCPSFGQLSIRRD